MLFHELSEDRNMAELKDKYYTWYLLVPPNGDGIWQKVGLNWGAEACALGPSPQFVWSPQPTLH